MASRLEPLELQEGFSLVTAPRFQPRRSWADRLCLNGGVEREGRRVHPRSDWRPPTTRELTLLVRRAPGRESPFNRVAVSENTKSAVAPHHEEICLEPWEAGLVAIPARLREAWWASAGWGVLPPGQDEGYRRFVAAVLEFLRFKRLPLPARCEADLLASRPDLRGSRLDPTTGELSGLGFSGPASRRTMGMINLGDETTHLVLLNVPAQGMRALLAQDGESDPWSLAPSDLVARFFEEYPDYPLTRVSLDPGEGVWFPRDDVVHDGWPGAKQDADVVLTIRGEMEESIPEPFA